PWNSSGPEKSAVQPSRAPSTAPTVSPSTILFMSFLVTPHDAARPFRYAAPPRPFSSTPATPVSPDDEGGPRDQVGQDQPDRDEVLPVEPHQLDPDPLRQRAHRLARLIPRDVGEQRRYVGVARALLRPHRLRGDRGERTRRPLAEQRSQQRAERVDVAPRIDRPGVAALLLRPHQAGRAHP